MKCLRLITLLALGLLVSCDVIQGGPAGKGAVNQDNRGDVITHVDRQIRDLNHRISKRWFGRFKKLAGRQFKSGLNKSVSKFKKIVTNVDHLAPIDDLVKSAVSGLLTMKTDLVDVKCVPFCLKSYNFKAAFAREKLCNLACDQFQKQSSKLGQKVGDKINQKINQKIKG